tara:strand:- start:1955 stop:2206 length:252 start_codon:yes stop_codon:yes gene_type:complete
MPAVKSRAKKEDTSNTINTAEFGRKYYDVLDVYTNKVISKLVENSNEINISRESIQKIGNILNEETTHAKNWGFDQLIKVLKG